MHRNSFFEPNKLRRYLVPGIASLVLWAVAVYAWCYAPGLRLVLFLPTLVVLPLPFLIQYGLARFRVVERLRLDRLPRWVTQLVLIATVAGLLALFVPRFLVILDEQPRISAFDGAPAKPVAIVFGAGISRNGDLSAELRDRVTTAVDLYRAGKVQKLLMSGDNRFLDYNEPGAMRKYALKLGVPTEAIVLDYAGRRTYDTCYRAGYIFGVQEAVLITQQYHLPRALYTCNALGVRATGVPAENRPRPYPYGNLRELPATLVALWEINISHPLPVLGKPEPIFSAGTASLLAWPLYNRVYQY